MQAKAHPIVMSPSITYSLVHMLALPQMSTFTDIRCEHEYTLPFLIFRAIRDISKFPFGITYHRHPGHPFTPSIYNTPKAMRPPKAPLNAEAMNRYATLIPNSSLVYLSIEHFISQNRHTRVPSHQLHRNSVMLGNKHPSKNPRKILVVTSPPKLCTKPVHMHTTPQQNVIVGITRLNCNFLTSIDVGNSASI